MGISINYSLYKTEFKNIPDGKHFYDNGKLYIKLLNSELEQHNIQTVNAVCFTTGEMKFFKSNVKVSKSYTIEKHLNEKEIQEKIKRLEE